MMLKWERCVTVLTAVTVAGSLLGCGGGSEPAAKSSLASAKESSTVSSVAVSSSVAKETGTGSDDGKMRDDISSIDFVNAMGNGINLGNTMEAYAHGDLMPASDITPELVTKCETAWGQPVTTQEIVDGMKNAGFDTLRIPVAWTNLMNYENDDYTIPEAYMKRVHEIVDYARNDDMYVIINDHWDGQWWGMFGQTETEDKAWAMYESIWKQVSAEFKDYGDHVIFESANEELGDRLNDEFPQGSGKKGILTEDECYTKTNEINQKFVDIIRSSGGNNDKRFLLIAGYNTDINRTSDARYKLPTDTVSDRLLLSVHFYDPSDYCIGTAKTWGKSKQFAAVNDLLAKLTAFTYKGIGVVIGEYGPQADKTTLKDGTPSYIKNLLDNCDYYGYCPVLWDCNSQYDRDNVKMSHDEIAEIYTAHSLASESGKSASEIKETAKNEMDELLAAAPKAREIPEDEAFSWLMYATNDWGKLYSVGDTYDEDSATAGVTATTVDVTGEGEYTVGVDFTGADGGSAKDLGFSAVGIMNGEQLYPGYSIIVEKVEINGEQVELTGTPYTTSDDGKCTRVNIVNPYIKETDYPEGYSAAVIDTSSISDVKTMSVTYKFIKSKKKGNRPDTAKADKKDDKKNTAKAEKTDAWLMYSNTDWTITSGTASKIEDVTDVGGVTHETAEIEGEGEYTVSLDFTGTPDGKVSDPFLIEVAVGKADAYPDYKIVPEKMLINGEEKHFKSDPPTGTEDNSNRLYIMNPWGDESSKVIYPADFSNVETLSITFKYTK